MSAVPIKSKAQRRKFADLLVSGEIDPEVYERWNREAGSKELPERVKSKAKKTKAKSAKKAKKAKKGQRRKTSARKRSV